MDRQISDSGAHTISSARLGASTSPRGATQAPAPRAQAPDAGAPDGAETGGREAQSAHEAQWLEVAAEVNRLRAEVAEVNRLRVEVAQLRAEVAAAQAIAAGIGSAEAVGHEAASPPAAGGRWSRRGVLLGAMGAAAGASAALASATPAAAAPGAPLTIGAANDGGSSQTALTSTNAFLALSVVNNESGNAISARANRGGTGVFATSASGRAVRAESGLGNGVEGWSNWQIGVLGDSPEGTGVEGRGEDVGVVGRTTRGVGVRGLSSDSHGVEGVASATGSGVAAVSNTGPGAQVRSNSGPTLRLSNGRATVPSQGSWLAGDIVAARQGGDSRAELWMCVVAGTPGIWRQLAGPSVAGGYVPIKPVRVYDSRWGVVPGVITGVMLPGATRTVSVADGRDSRGNVTDPNVVPRGSSAVTLNVTVVDTVGRGNLALVPDGRFGSDTSSINWSADGQVLANGLTLAINANARTLDIIGRSNRTNVIVDITGFYSGA